MLEVVFNVPFFIHLACVHLTGFGVLAAIHGNPVIFVYIIAPACVEQRD